MLDGLGEKPGADKLSQRVGSTVFEPVAINDDPPLLCVVQAFAEAVRVKSRDTAPPRFEKWVIMVFEQCERIFGEHLYASVNQQSHHGRNQYSER